jgi:hypothetical protein
MPQKAVTTRAIMPTTCVAKRWRMIRRLSASPVSSPLGDLRGGAEAQPRDDAERKGDQEDRLRELDPVPEAEDDERRDEHRGEDHEPRPEITRMY